VCRYVGERNGRTVIATTRRHGRIDLLRAVGVDYSIVDDGTIAEAVRKIFPEGVDGAIELVDCGVLADTLKRCALMAPSALPELWAINGRWRTLIPSGSFRLACA
jgi:D-arabinose 1-dehydrogenase-like Zn-dependent alcohol dehydrogenase